jgi:NAD(P)H-dependent flavin oxidoreductase YrpB (nitropropane dioxygenase family)
MSMPSLQIGHIQSRLPIVQGGMGGGISLSGLVSSVINCGGIGVVTSVGTGLFEPDFQSNMGVADKRALSKEILKIKGSSNGPLGVNIMVAFTTSNELIETAINAGVDIIFLGAGLPLVLPECALIARRAGKVMLVPIVSSAKAFDIISRAWQRRYNLLPDAVVVEGPMAGGHLGFELAQIDNPAYSLDQLVKETMVVVQTIESSANKKIPLIAGGGVYTGIDIRRMLSLGASGVQMATRFVATVECDASQEFKDAYVNARKEDITIIRSPLGLPGRALRNQFLIDVERGERKTINCNWQCLKTCKVKDAPYCIGNALINAKIGKLQDGFAFAGSNVYRVDKIMSVCDLMEELCEGYEKSEIVNI